MDMISAAQRLFAASMPIAGTLAERYLNSRGITDVSGLDVLRFHPRCYCQVPNGQRRASSDACGGHG